jgi:hypothetical protein
MNPVNFSNLVVNATYKYAGSMHDSSENDMSIRKAILLQRGDNKQDYDSNRHIFDDGKFYRVKFVKNGKEHNMYGYLKTEDFIRYLIVDCIDM